ncbi:MAG TPA: sugar transferase [Mycobacteriales bacterium]|nr:sugar transferase [Mycobacteriales bacterium]
MTVAAAPSDTTVTAAGSYDPVAGLLLHRPSRTWTERPLQARLAKRTIDIVGAAVLLLVTLPAVLIAAVAISLTSRGGPLFAQERVGKDGRTFRFYKLRTMVRDNDDSQHVAYVASLIRGEAPTHDGVFKLTNDSRVTTVGRFLRRYSIDELPQLANVLLGDMSLVGPRPALPREVELYDDFARQRLRVKPGITGLWQVSGRCELTFQDMVALDLHYASWWSVATDLKILARTPAAAFSARGAA